MFKLVNMHVLKYMHGRVRLYLYEINVALAQYVHFLFLRSTCANSTVPVARLGSTDQRYHHHPRVHLHLLIGWRKGNL